MCDGADVIIAIGVNSKAIIMEVLSLDASLQEMVNDESTGLEDIDWGGASEGLYYTKAIPSFCGGKSCVQGPYCDCFGLDWEIVGEVTKTEQEKMVTTLTADKAGLLDILEQINECPYMLDPATIPRGGIEVAPKQVVCNMSIAWVKIREMRKVVAEHNPPEENVF